MNGFKKVYMYMYIHTHTHNRILLSNKKNEILPFAATWMDLEGIMLTEMSDIERQILYGITYRQNLKNTTNQ